MMETYLLLQVTAMITVFQLQIQRYIGCVIDFFFAFSFFFAFLVLLFLFFFFLDVFCFLLVAMFGITKGAKYKAKFLEFDTTGYTPPWLVNFEGTIGERHAENKYIANHESFDSIHENIVTFVNLIHSDKQLLNVFREIALRLQGLDVFWNGSCAYVEKMDANLKNTTANASVTKAISSMASIHQTKNKSVTKFATLSIVSFPMCIKLVFDEGHEAILRYRCM